MKQCLTPLMTIAAFAAVAASAQQQQPFSNGPRLKITSPWSMASGAEWAGDYPRFNALIKDAGVRSIRLGQEWQTIQPREGEWNFEGMDKMVADARKNNMQIIGVWCYFAPWASADGGTRRGPVKNMQFWRDYVRVTAERYRNDIEHWEVWNEFNGSFYQGNDKVREYADLAVAAYEEIKKVDPTIKVGLSVANFDVAFLNATIQAGAKDHFDFVCVHPYENLGAAMAGEESSYLSLAGSLRTMLAANNQRADIPLWITETGRQSTIKADAESDLKQAEALVKVYILSLAQGFDRICWFEVRGPAYGSNTDHGIIRHDWTARPAYDILKKMTAALGDTPKYIGWQNIGKEGFGFVFQGAQGPALVAWASKNGDETFTLNGRQEKLTRMPRIFTSLPAALVSQAKLNSSKPFPWGQDYAKASEVTVRLGAKNLENGLKQHNPNTTAVENDLTETWARTNFKIGGEGRYVYFRVDPTFGGFGSSKFDITVVARRIANDKPAGMKICYESLGNGYTDAPGGYKNIDAGGWQELTWSVDDANFVGQWGWNFRTDCNGSGNEFFIKEVRVKKR